MDSVLSVPWTTVHFNDSSIRVYVPVTLRLSAMSALFGEKGRKGECYCT